MKHTKTILVFALVLSAFFFYTCKKESTETTTTSQDTLKSVYNQTSVSNEAVAMGIYTDVVTDVLSSSDSAHAHAKAGTCPSVNMTPLAGYPKTLTIDFGSTGCTYNSKTVKGKITATLSGAIRTTGTKVSIVFDNFKVDTVGVSGTLILSVLSATSSQIAIRDSVKNGVLTLPSGTVSCSFNMDLTWIIGSLTIYTDDTFTIANCNISGTNKEGKTFTGTVTETLLIKASCKEVVDGKLTISTSGEPYSASIDFGDGTCDGTAIVTTKIKKTVGSQTFEQDYSYTVTLP